MGGGRERERGKGREEMITRNEDPALKTQLVKCHYLFRASIEQFAAMKSGGVETNVT